MESRGELIHQIVDSMIHTNRYHHTSCDKFLSQLGIHPSQHRMLMYLYHFKNVNSQRELAKGLHISTAVATVTLQKLEEEGYVIRTSCKKDKRTLQIELTQKSEILIEKTKEIFTSIDEAMFCDLSDSELLNLFNLFQKIQKTYIQGETL